MKLRAIELDNVRRFTRAVRIEGIGDGLNLLCEPNEYGKSTLFDALQALFFTPHGSQKQEVKALRPHAGGAPEVTVEIETAEGMHRVTKRWLSRPIAEVHRDGRLIAQADEAEAWISGLITGGDGGPAGLLWVRQGLVALDDGSDKERKAAEAARRDLLSSVTGEVEAMTGGRRMDAALARCRAELAEYATGTGKPKANGPWRDALDAVEDLTRRRDALTETTRALHEQLDARKRKRRELAEIEDPEEAAVRKARLEEAEARFEAARQHADKVEAAAGKVKTEGLEVANRSSQLERIRTARAELSEAQEAHEAARQAAGPAGQAQLAAERALTDARAALEAAKQEAVRADEVRRKAERQQRAREGAAHRGELTEKLRRAEEARDRLATLAAKAKLGPDPAAMRDIEEKARELSVARSLREGAAPQLLLEYEPGAESRARLHGRPLPGSEPVAIPEGAELTLDGIGTLHVRPGAGGRDDGRVETAEDAFRAALAAIAAETLEEARAAADARTEAANAAREVRAQLQAIAPDGPDALRQAIAAIPEPEADDPDLPDLATAEAQQLAAAERRNVAQAAWESAGERNMKARVAAASAKADENAAADRLARAQEALERLGPADEAALVADLARARAAFEAAEARLEALRREAPDLEAAQSTLERARAVAQSAREDAGRLKEEIIRLDERIAAAAGDAVEEELADTEGRLEAAQAQLAVIEREVKVLQRAQAAAGVAMAGGRADLGRRHAAARHADPRPDRGAGRHPVRRHPRAAGAAGAAGLCPHAGPGRAARAGDPGRRAGLHRRRPDRADVRRVAPPGWRSADHRAQLPPARVPRARRQHAAAGAGRGGLRPRCRPTGRCGSAGAPQFVVGVGLLARRRVTPTRHGSRAKARRPARGGPARNGPIEADAVYSWMLSM